MNRTKRIVAAILAIAMCAVLFAGCGTKTESAKTGVEDGVLTVAMECAYAPYNWTQSDDSNGAVPLKDSSDYANGYDIMMAKKICEANGWKLEVVRLDWDSLVPAVQTGKVDAVIAGQSMTADRMQQVGVGPAAAGNELRLHVAGGVVGKFYENGLEYDIRMRLKENQRDLKTSFSQSFVPNLSQPARAIPLSRISHTSSWRVRSHARRRIPRSCRCS